MASLEKDCYGGRFTAEVWDAKSNQHVPHVRRRTLLVISYSDAVSALREVTSYISSPHVNPASEPRSSFFVAERQHAEVTLRALRVQL